MAEAAPEAISTVHCHLKGVTRVCFSPDGSTIFTGGNDCLVRIHNAREPDSEPGFHDDHGDAVTSLAASDEYLITASVDNIARRFTFPGNEHDGFVTRSAGVPIRWVSLDKAGERVAVCSDDLLVKIVNIKDTSRTSLLSDNAKPVRSAAWDPTGKFLVTAGCDGKLKIYDTSGSTPVNVKIMEGVITPSDADANVSMYAAWHPSGNFFAVPLRTNDIGIVSKDGWAKQTTFANEHRSPVNELAWSPNGKYLASAAGAQILVWNTESRAVVAKYTNSSPVTGLTWSPISNLLAFTDIEGAFHRWTEPVPLEFPSPVLSDAAVAKKVDKLLDDGLFGDDEDMEEKGDELDGDDFGDDWIIDDDGVGYADAEDDAEDKWAKGRTEVVNVTKAQESFVPGSTQWKNKKRYLAFNMIGVVDATDQDTHQVVNVEFHDKSARRGYHFSDQAKYTMASLGEQGIVYAAPSEGGTPSTVHYRGYDSWASASDWQISLLPGEDALSVAAGGPADGLGAVIVATSRGFVRFFTASGVQRYLWRLGEDVVTMAADRETVIIVHREGGTSLDGCQNLRYTLMDLEEFDILQEGRVPLPKKTTLKWCGFTSDGAPAIYDSAGLLSVLDRFRRPGQARWVPLFDGAAAAGIKPNKRESYWPVGVSRTYLSCVLLKGQETEPWFPRPLIQEVDLRMPLLGLEATQGSLEESVARGRVVAPADPESTIAIDKQLLQLVQGACKADQLGRALDLARLMTSTSTLEAAHKLATFYHLPGLGEKIAAVKHGKERDGRRKVIARDMLAGKERVRSTSPVKRDPARQFADFAPTTRRRTVRNSDVHVSRPETPGAGGNTTFIPETPTGDDEGVTETPGFDDDGMTGGFGFGSERVPSPPPAFANESPKRPAKREREDDPFALPSLPKENAPKNPFAKKDKPSNPFAKAAQAKPLDSVKSTSFFDRVDDIEAHKPKRKAPVKKPAGQGKQMSLAAFRRPVPVAKDSFASASTETDGDADAADAVEDEETQQSTGGVLEETQIQETVVDIEPEEF